jgi:hypothetical protein
MPCQQDRLYAAETWVDNGPVFADVDAVQVWLDALRDTRWWEQWCPNVLKVEVGIGRPGKGVAGVGWFEKDKNVGRLEFARSAELNERQMVHELAHVLAQARKDSQSHDPWFARVYLEITYAIRGVLEYEQLRYGYIREGVDYDAEGLAPR